MAIKENKVRVPQIKIILPEKWPMLLFSIKKGAKTAQSKMKGRYFSNKFENTHNYRLVQQYFIRECPVPELSAGRSETAQSDLHGASSNTGKEYKKLLLKSKIL